jgi:hypothetical protein
MSRISSFSFFRAVELSLLHTVISSGLSPLSSSLAVHVCLAQTPIFVNGRRTYNPYMQLYLGDIVSINVFFSGVDVSVSKQDPRRRLATLAKVGTHSWAAPLYPARENPAHLEVDELTASCVILFEPRE